MRLLSHVTKRQTETESVVLTLFVLLLAAVLPGCAGGGTSSGTTLPPPPAITISVTPATANVLLGKTLQLTATVAGTSNTAVAWSISSLPGANAVAGSISPSGLYTAPADFPSPATVQLTATSVASPSVSASVRVTVISDISIGVSQPSANIELGAKQSFGATVTSSGLPDTTVRWSLSGGACPATCGSVDPAGTYTAPPILPSPATVMLIAQSVADPSKQASVLVTIVSDFTLQIAAPASLATSATAAIVATLTPVPGSSPSTALRWSLSGAGCSGIACGTVSSVTTQETGTNTNGGTGADSENANYTAPPSAPSPNTVTVTVIPLADPSKRAQAVIVVQAAVGVTLLPVSETLAINHRATFAVQVSGGGNIAISWSVNGIPGGNLAFGQVCAVGSSLCSPVTSSSAAQVDFVAPAALPSPNPVTLTATSVADSTKFATAQVTILNHVVVSVLPGSVTLAPGATQPFTASVLGTTNQSVIWQLQGAACSVSGACGSTDSSGNYSAPGTSPSPGQIQVVAISSDDTSQSGSASVTISSGAHLQSIHPASVYAGGSLGFVLRAGGGGFVATSPSTGSTLLVGGTPRTTNCLSATQCTAPVSAVDVATPGNVQVQVRNPDGSLSNILPLVVAALNVTDAAVTLSEAAPSATGINIIVVQPTTAGVSQPGDDVDLNVAALGSFSAGTNTCSLGGNPVVLARPIVGAASYDICAFSQSGLDSSMAYSVTGPGDASVVAQQPLGLGIIRLTLQVTSSAQPGARTLFVQNLNLDKTAASGVLEVQ